MNPEKLDKHNISLLKEEIVVSKKQQSNKVLINKNFRETSHIETLALKNENVEINEVLINKEIDEFPEIIETDDLLIIPVVKEIEVVTKKKILVKEIHVKKIVSETMKNIPYSIKEEYLTVSKTPKKDYK